MPLVDEDPSFLEGELGEGLSDAVLGVSLVGVFGAALRDRRRPSLEPLDCFINSLLPVEFDEIRRRQDAAVEFGAQRGLDPLEREPLDAGVEFHDAVLLDHLAIGFREGVPEPLVE